MLLEYKLKTTGYDDILAFTLKNVYLYGFVVFYFKDMRRLSCKTHLIHPVYVIGFGKVGVKVLWSWL